MEARRKVFARLEARHPRPTLREAVMELLDAYMANGEWRQRVESTPIPF
jgi:hypothetical protein